MKRCNAKPKNEIDIKDKLSKKSNTMVKKKLVPKKIESEDVSPEMLSKQEDVVKKYIKKNNFIMDRSNDISNKLIQLMESEVDREDATNKLNKFLGNKKKATEVERGILEWTLVYSINQNVFEHIIPFIYEEKLKDILTNLDEKSSVKNVHLKKRILDGTTDAHWVAFLQPQQIHPEKWADVIKKKELRDYKMKNLSVSDAYQCRKCGERKCKVTQLQTRSADEAMTSFITCLVCHNTFKT